MTKPLKVFTSTLLDELTATAIATPRARLNHNIHDSHAEPVQRFFNAVEPSSYLRPHRQLLVPRDKLLIAVRGSFAAILFDDDGAVVRAVRFAVASASDACGLEIPAGWWNTVVSMESGSVLLEVKAGPFDPDLPREPAPWAPAEGSPEASAYLESLRRHAERDPAA